MKIISINVGRPRHENWNSKTISTGIFKEPTKEAIILRKLNLDGDEQANLEQHGGENRAVYVYPFEHYDYWHSQLPKTKLEYGIFGENFTTEGLFENTVHIGDRFRIGTAEVRVTGPRIPCFKLDIRLDRSDMVGRFLKSRRTGFFFSVLEEGEVKVGDAIELLQRDVDNIKVSDILHLYVFEKDNIELMERLVKDKPLPKDLHSEFLRRISKLKSS